MKKIKNIEQWLMTMLAVVLLAACSRSDSDEISSSEERDCYIEFYVYQPDRPMVTRATDEAVIAPTDVESTIHSLKIWVFRHSDASNHAPLGYLEVDETTDDNTTDDNTTDDKKAGKTLLDIMNKEGQQMFKMKVPAEFADHPQNVDVYVVANEGNSTLNSTLNENSTREDIKSAKITSFGVSTYYSDDAVIKAVPSDGLPSDGLPMSAMLENQPIYGSFPTLRIGDADGIATLRLTRAVSKLRFVICRKKETGNDKRILESITSIQLDAGMIPTWSFLMPVAASSYNEATYNATAMKYVQEEAFARTTFETNLTNSESTIPQVSEVSEDPEAPVAPVGPLKYAYTTQTPEDYEALINEGVSKHDLKEFGITYLRESPKQLTGTIKYKIKKRDNTTTSWKNATTSIETATFSMAAPGEFMRNHSWIIYIFFMDEKLHTLTVTHLGMRSWSDGGSTDHSVYNW